MPALKNPRHERRFYVYALIDGRDGEPFYVGKGSGNRAKMHLRDWHGNRVVNARKHTRIGEIVRAGATVEIKMLAEGLSESAALRLEKSHIAERVGSLTNISRGRQSAADKDAAWAREWLSRVKPLGQWLRERTREPWEIKTYFRVIFSLCRVARRGA